MWTFKFENYDYVGKRGENLKTTLNLGDDIATFLLSHE